MASAVETETLRLADGTTMDFAKVPGVDDSLWQEAKAYIEKKPELARNFQKHAKDPEAMRGFLQTQAIADHYGKNADAASQEKLKALESDPELASMFEDIKKNGLEAIMKYCKDEALMLKVNQKMGGLPDELRAAMQKIDGTALNIHEAAKEGDLTAVKEFLSQEHALDVQDGRGITPLGYAVGANRIAVVKLLMDKRANPFAVDSAGNCALHYAAGYGREALVDYLLKAGASANQTNAQGQTPMAVATQNKQSAVVEFLKAKGVSA